MSRPRRALALPHRPPLLTRQDRVGPLLDEPIGWRQLVISLLLETAPRPLKLAVCLLDQVIGTALLLGLFGLATLLDGSKRQPSTGPLTASGLLLSLYLLTVGALVWVAFETRWSRRRRA